MHERHWHILGAGAIGSLFACLFQDAGIRCSLLLREGHAAPHNGTRQIRLHEGEHSRAHIVEAGPAAGPEPIHYLL
ncbi:MAG TPA: 2-dehydropantoate 2-reductase, partial [Halieaceae bacterium]|nr:2-dehydropantoate 2-reductase [Halieaceae bacterium]